MTDKEKDIFNLQWAKVHCIKVAEAQLQSKFARLELEAAQNAVLIKVYLFKVYKQINKKAFSKTIIDLCNSYCPSLNFKMQFLDSSSKDLLSNPKFYYQKIKQAYLTRKTPPFNYIPKLELMTLPNEVKGLRVVVKGKRGARKFKKVVKNGNPSYHSNTKEISQYKGTIETTLGTLGVSVFLKK